jgi:hypothetical protein
MRVAARRGPSRASFFERWLLDPCDRERGRVPSMSSPPFDYDAAAEIYPSRARGSRRHPVGYKRFDSTAEALRFAIEQLPADALVGAYLEIGEERYDAREMRALYDAPAYPLPRNRPPDGADAASVSAPATPGNSRSRRT